MKIICIGLNYRNHAREMNKPIPVEPVVFLKPDSAILKKNKPFFLPDFSQMIQYETEVVVKISRLGKGISPEYAGRYYDEITLGIDITARDIQAKNAAPVIYRQKMLQQVCHGSYRKVLTVLHPWENSYP